MMETLKILILLWLPAVKPVPTNNGTDPSQNVIITASCYFTYPYIHLNIPLPLDKLKLPAYSRQSPQIHLQSKLANDTWHTWNTCRTVSSPAGLTSRSMLDCRTWRLHTSITKDLDKDYQLRIEYLQRSQWKFINVSQPQVWNPIGNLFQCFDKHEVKDLSVVTQTKDELTIAWQQNPDNNLYGFELASQMLIITPTSRKGKSMRFPVDIDCVGMCSFTVKEFHTCTKYRLCVQTNYLHAHRPFFTCILTTTPGSCGGGFTHDKVAMVIIAVTLAVILIALACTYKKLRARSGPCCKYYPNERDESVLPISSYEGSYREHEEYDGGDITGNFPESDWDESLSGGDSEKDKISLDTYAKC